MARVHVELGFIIVIIGIKDAAGVTYYSLS